MDQLLLRWFIDRELEKSRYADPKRLTRYGRKVYSQSDEDGILAEIFHRIGATARTFVEIGVETGIECNTLWLLLQGWTGLWIEANAASVEMIESTHRPWLDSGALSIAARRVSQENINEAVPMNLRDRLDLLSIDIDYNDYWIWQALTVVRPRVVVIEYNATWPPPVSVTVPYSAEAKWHGTNYFGASLAAFAQLGSAKGYSLVACGLSGVNAFFVRTDLVGERFLAPGSAEEHFEPARYFLSQLESGHRPEVGPLIAV